MKKSVYKIFALVLFVLCLFCFVGCGNSYEPYMGRWCTSVGDELVLNSSGTFSSTINDVTVHGSYTVYFNTLVLTNETIESETYCEWDIRGSSLYLIYETGTTQFFYIGEPEE